MQPYQTRRTGFEPGERQRHERQRTPAQPPQTPDAERQDQHQEQIEQRPARQPGVGTIVDPGDGQQIPARRQMQPAGRAVEHQRPARGRYPVGFGAKTAVGDQIQAPAPHLDTGRCVGIETGDEHRLVIDPRLTQIETGRGLQPPASGQIAVETIARAIALSVEVEPDLAREPQSIRFGVRVAASLLGECEHRTWTGGIDRQPRPVARKPRLARVEPLQAGQLDPTAFGLGGEGPDLALGPGRGQVGRARQSGHSARMVTRDLQHPASGTHLDAQRAVRLQAGRQGTDDVRRDAFGQQNRTEPDLAGASGDLQFEPGQDAQW